MNKNSCNVLLCDEWQYQCCGREFKVGDYIYWSTSPFSHLKDYSYSILSLEKIDYLYEDCAIGTGDLIGKVKRISLLKKNNDNILDFVEDFNSMNELIKKYDDYYVLITLEDFSFKKYRRFKNDTSKKVVLCGNILDFDIKQIQNIKKNNVNIDIMSTNKKSVEILYESLVIEKSFSKVEKYICSNFADIYNYDSVINFICINDRKIYDELYKYILKTSIKCTIFYIDLKNNNIKICKNNIENLFNPISINESNISIIDYEYDKISKLILSNIIS